MPTEADFRHDKIDVNGVRLHYVTVGSGPPLVLLHGFPQTWYQWRRIMPALAENFTAIAPDYRGAGLSSRPVSGYDKVTMATDIRELVQAVAGDEPVALVGHDLGSFVAYAYAATFPAEVSKLVLIDAVTLGTKAWDRVSSGPRLYHVAFHGARDVAEMLVTGRERAYLEQFFTYRAYLDLAVLADLDVYVQAYQAPGALRAAFEVYRAIPEDVEVNRALIAKAKLPMPLLVVGGDISSSGPSMIEMAQEIALDSRGVVISRCGHWVAEEQPDQLLAELTSFLGS